MEPLEIIYQCIAHPATIPAWTIATAEATYLTYLNAKEKTPDTDYSAKTYLWGYTTGVIGAFAVTGTVLTLEKLL